jgi:hypothetical protein
VEKGNVIESGTEDFRPRRGSSNGTLYMEYRRWLSMMVPPTRKGQDPCFDLIVYEMSHQRGGAATEHAMNMTGRVQEIAAAIGIEVLGVHTATLKKETVGKGNASKQDMVNWAQRILGRAPEDDNEADGIALAMWGHERYAEIEDKAEPDSEGAESSPENPESGEAGGDYRGEDGMGADHVEEFV